MKKRNFLLILSTLILTAPLLAGNQPSPPTGCCQKQELSLLQQLLGHVRACVQFNPELQNKEEILAVIQALEENSFISETGNDDLRNKYVFLQGCFEHALSSAQALGEIKGLTGVIHTPTIATPLCVRPEESIDSVLDPSIRHDPAKRLTVRSRTQTIRDFLAQGAKLYMVYPEGGETKRTPEQLEVYNQARTAFSEGLIDWPLSCTSLDPEMVGALYFFSTPEGKQYVFSIKSFQAIDIREKSEWGLWFGAVDEPAVAERVDLVTDYLDTNEGPGL